MKNTNQILKGASILLIAAVMILSTVAVTANTGEQNLTPLQTKVGITYIPEPVIKESMPSRLGDFTEGFEGGSIPTHWLNIDYDGDLYFWEIPDSSGFTAHSGTYCAASASYVNDPGMALFPDNWLVTPLMTASATSQLTYWVAAQDADWSEEHIEVWISTTGFVIPDDFTDQVDDYTCPFGSSEWEERNVDLSSYDGEDIFIAFRHCDVTDMFWIKIDDVLVTDVELVEPGDPALDCDGSLSWADVEPGATVEGSFAVENSGDSYSFLNWEIDSYPDWGSNWTFDPDGGTDIPKGAPVTVDVEVVAPEDPETEFTGEIVLVNSDDPDDTCIIDVALATPVSQQSLIFQFFEMLAQRFPILGMILAAIY